MLSIRLFRNLIGCALFIVFLREGDVVFSLLCRVVVCFWVCRVVVFFGRGVGFRVFRCMWGLEFWMQGLGSL